MLGGLCIFFSFLFYVGAQDDTVDFGKLKANLESAKDVDELCCFWAYEGQCDTNPKYMKVNCPRSCGTIGCLEKNIIDCQTQVIKRCGGNYTLFGSFVNNVDESKKFWAIKKNLAETFKNPQQLNTIDVTVGRKSKRSTRRAKRQSLTQIQKDFPDKKIVFVPDRPPYNQTIGALVYKTSNGLTSFCSAAIVNIGTKEEPLPAILTAAHCVVQTTPTCCTLKTCSCDPSKDTFCDKIKDEHCTPSHSAFQFNANYRRNKGEGVEVIDVDTDSDKGSGGMDTTRIHLRKKICFELCSDASVGIDSRHDYAIIELADFENVQTYLEIATEVPDWAANLGYALQNCHEDWKAADLPGVADVTTPDVCWGNNKFQQPIGIGGPILENQIYNGGNYSVHDQDPSGNGNSGASWLSKDMEVVAVTSFRDGTGRMWGAQLLQEDFQQLRDNVVQGVNPRSPTDGEQKPDVEASCCGWAKRGECDNFPFFMRVNCQESCGTPGCPIQKALLCTPKVNQDC